MEVNVPPYFLCPISLQIMRDPVTLSTGITYDRSSIHQWLLNSSSAATPTCPVTRQPLLDTSLTPNSTLCRLIQTWYAANPPAGHPSTSPRVPLGKANIVGVLDGLRRPNPEADSLRKLRDVITDGEEGRRMAEEAGAAHVLADLAKKSTASIDELIAVLHHLRLSEDGLCDLFARNTDVLETLTGVLKVSTCQTREYAISIARSVLEAVSPVRMVAVKGEFFAEVVRVVEDRVSPMATKEALRVLAELTPWGRNRVRAAEAGAVGAIVELLLEEGPERRRVWEVGMVVMEMVCGCAEGRQAVVGHAAGIATVARALLGVSRLATEKAARLLCAVAKHAGTAEVVREMAEVGAVSRLCVAMQVEEGANGGRRRTRTTTRERVVEVLRLHSKALGKSPCVDSRLLTPWL